MTLNYADCGAIGCLATKLCLAALCLLPILILPSCKLSEDRVIKESTLSKEGVATFDIKVNGAESPVQTIKIDIKGIEHEDCRVEILNMGPGNLGSALTLQQSADEGSVTLAQGERKAVYDGPAEAARFGVWGLEGKVKSVRVFLTVKDYKKESAQVITRVLWADGP